MNRETWKYRVLSTEIKLEYFQSRLRFSKTQNISKIKVLSAETGSFNTEGHLQYDQR